MKRLAFLLAASAFAFLLHGCGGQGSKADYPTDFKVVAGDGSATISWSGESDVDYWIFYGPGDNITTSNWATNGGAVIPKAVSPRIITGLTNGRTYSFTINGRKDSGPGGQGAPTQVITPQLSGNNWAAGTPLGTGTLTSIFTGQGTLGFAVVTVSTGGAIYSSITPQPFVARTNPQETPTDLHTVFYGSLGFIAAGANGALLRSIDGVTWTVQTSPTTATLRSGTSALTGNYVAVGDGGAMVRSSDSISWETTTSGTTNNLTSATFGGGRYVVVGAGGTIVTSTDSNSWQGQNSPTTNDLLGVVYAAVPSTDPNTQLLTENLYIAVGKAGAVITSKDGLDWTLLPPFTTSDLTGIAFGGQFVAVGPAGVLFTSQDSGATWVQRNSGTTNDLKAAIRTVTGYTAVGTQGTNVSTF